MAQEYHQDGLAKVPVGVQHNFATGKKYKNERAAVAGQRAQEAGGLGEAMEVEIDPNHADGKALSVMHLTFRYTSLYNEAPIVLDDVTVQLEPGSRCLLLGSNGAGKSTMLNVLGGKHMHPAGSVMVLNQPAFHDTHPGIVNITGNWTRTANFEGHSVNYAKDISVQDLIDGVQQANPERIAKIVKVLDIDLGWRMHIVSDGQRRRVQLLMGLMKEWQVLLLDEVTVDLDVVARANLLQYLAEECDERGATIMYATHIFDGLDKWATHFARIRSGVMLKCAPVNEFEDYQGLIDNKSTSPLFKTVMAWLRQEKEEDRDARRQAASGDKSMEVDLKQSNYNDTPFAQNRMHNRTG